MKPDEDGTYNHYEDNDDDDDYLINHDNSNNNLQNIEEANNLNGTTAIFPKLLILTMQTTMKKGEMIWKDKAIKTIQKVDKTF